jgi:2-methylcitrate dehydratase PrpD
MLPKISEPRVSREGKMDASILLSANAVKVTYDDIPRQAVDIAKKDILDTLGVAVAGSSVPGGREIVELQELWGGNQESTVIMFRRRVPSPYAALANGTMSHALDYDDAHESVLHAGTTVIPAAFAIAERVGRISGKEFITAVTLGIDVVCRLGKATNKHPTESGWLYTPLYGIFGAATAAGKLLGLNEQQMVNAFGIAYSQAAGNQQCVPDGALTKRLQAGFAASNGVLSALMASRGLTGTRDTLEGEYGLYQVYHRGDYDPTPLTTDLGSYFATVELIFKPYPCCLGNHSAIDATLALIKEHCLTAEDIDEILVRCSEENARLLFKPLEIKQKPRVFIDAQFSIPWAVATALVKGKFTMDDITPEAISNPAVLQVAERVKCKVDRKLVKNLKLSVILEAKRKGRRQMYSKRVDIAKGHPKNPMSWEELATKFRDCGSHAIRPLAKSRMEKVISLIANLEEVKNVAEIIWFLSGNYQKFTGANCDL